MSKRASVWGVIAVALLVQARDVAVAVEYPCSAETEARLWDAEGGEFPHLEALLPVTAAVTDGAEAFPTVVTEQCGRTIAFADAFTRGLISVPLSGGRSVVLLPLFLQRKTDWACTRIKPRVACVFRSEPTPEGGRQLTLRSATQLPFMEATLRIAPDGRVETVDAYFAALPGIQKSGRKTVDVRDRIRAAMAETRCAGAACTKLRGYAADRRGLEILRRTRIPRLPAPEVKRDVELLAEAVGTLHRDAQALQAVIGANEISLDMERKTALQSPFEIVDAVFANSGPSFGVHQIDVATNACTEAKCWRQPFRDALSRIAQDASTSPALTAAWRSALPSRNLLFEKSIRTFSPEELALFHGAVSALTRDMRAEGSRAAYLALYADYLKTDTGCMARLQAMGDPFAGSLFARLAAIDVRNQYGSAQRVIDAATKAWSEAGNQAAVREGIKARILQTKYGSEHPGDVDRRLETVARVAQRFGEGPATGRVEDCDGRFPN